MGVPEQKLQKITDLQDDPEHIALMCQIRLTLFVL